MCQLMSIRKVHRVKDRKRLIRHYRIIPYSELVDVLREDGVAFFEDSTEEPLKRQTVHKAARKLSEMLGKKVVAEKKILRLDNGESMEGYSFSVKE